MLDFIKNALASLVGFILALFLIFMFFFVLIVATSGDSEPFIRDNSVLHIHLTANVGERDSSDPFEEIFAPQGPAFATLESLENNLRKAAVDDRIDGVLLEIDFLQTPWAHLQEMRRMIKSFKKESGKFVYATTNDIGMNEGGYYLATAADSIFAPPMTYLQLDGLRIQGVFFRNLLDKIGVEAYISNEGVYKTAGDPFIRDRFSDADREQLTAIMNDVAAELEEAIAERNNMSMAEVREILNNQPVLAIESYVEMGLVDELISFDNLKNRIKTQLEIDDDRSLSLVPNRRYSRVSNRTAGLDRAPSDQIAIIYMDGVILPSAGAEGPFDGDSGINARKFGRSLEAALDNDNVKAIVIRISSPGGAASTSDVIWEMIRDAREKKPVVASMGNVAASGGYYISMGAEKIFAERTTITGSIGVIGTRFTATDLLNDRIGLTFDEIQIHENAGWFDPSTELTPAQRTRFDRFISEAYEQFVNRVADSREMTYDEVHALAQGRVWSGEDAYEAGLTDAVGGLSDAVAAAAELAGIDRWAVTRYPRQQTLIESLTASSQVSARNMLGYSLPYQDEIEFLARSVSQNRPGAWAIMPYHIEIK